MSNKTHPLEVGSVLSASWGYDQTNVDYYQVAELKGKKSVILVPIGSTTVHHGGPGGNKVVPDPEHIREWDVLLGLHGLEESKKGKLKRVSEDGTVKICSHAWAHPDSGSPRYETDSMFGH